MFILSKMFKHSHKTNKIFLFSTIFCIIVQSPFTTWINRGMHQYLIRQLFFFTFQQFPSCTCNVPFFFCGYNWEYNKLTYFKSDDRIFLRSVLLFIKLFFYAILCIYICFIFVRLFMYVTLNKHKLMTIENSRKNQVEQTINKLNVFSFSRLHVLVKR